MRHRSFRAPARALFFCIIGLAGHLEAARAQGSVTLYSILDNGFTYTNNAGGHQSIMQQDGNNTGASGSRFGLRGNEPLGGGLSALFLLENGFTLPNGGLQQGGLLFGRQAYVGVGSLYGTVTLGRQYDSLADYLQPLSAASQWGGYMTGHADEVDNIVDTNRVNNSIKYASRTYAGFRFGGVYSVGGVAGHASQNQVWSAGIGYVNGPFSAGAAYLDAKEPNFGFFGGNGNALAPNSVGANGQPNDNNIGATRPAFSGFASAGSEQIAAAGGAYTFGAATAGLVYSNVRFDHLGAVQVSGTPTFAGGPSAMFNSIEVNFRYHITPSLLAGLAYNWARSNSLQTAQGTQLGATYNQLEAGLDYSLSKRTDLYCVSVFQHASGTDSTGSSAHASINGLTPSSTDKQIAVRVALRTRF